MHILEHDDEALKNGISTRSYDDVNFQSRGSDGDGAEVQTWMLLIEFSDAFDAPFASYKENCKEFAEGLTEHGVDFGTLKEEIYGLVVAMEE